MYSGHHGWLVQWLQRKLGNSGDAADLAQDTYVRVATGRTMPRPEEARPYLVRIAHNLVIDLYRRRKLEAAYLEALAALPEAVSPSHEDTMIVLQTLGAIDCALAGLPAKVREAFFMSQFDGMTYSAIADALGIAVATVRKHMLTATRACFLAMQDPGAAPASR
ncbi:MAG: putative RNA polymerase sigma factor FecI [Herbaspirillum frisingense]|uniref:Putative RNA polymerase sigma factor FecI n=1 Tax=Herbaspirillum frisingense TaxID=92645 RepID=A0A7V8G045_9BURK|nr:MAG: putative RNA polymerase sigma factor FecI [Herbaspirillum frisingense]